MSDKRNITVTTTIHSTTSLSLPHPSFPSFPPSVASLSFEKPRPSTTSTTTSRDNPILLPSSDSTKTPLSILLHRTRLALHLAAAALSFGLIGQLVSATKRYHDTKDSYFFVAGELGWPQNGLVMDDSLALLGVGIAGAVLSCAVLLASSLRCVRHNTTLGLATSAFTTLLLFGLSLGGAVYYYNFRPSSGQSFWAWTCARRNEQHPDINFRAACQEVRGAWGCAVGLVAVSVVLGIVVGVAAVHGAARRRQERGWRKSGGFVPVRRETGLESMHSVVISGEKV
ncbi:hypothetical protein BJ508DRAFT_366911 [Ascobolus immersus RN42]|uniref:Uncharacterized protein n=1 Tax=Ascobolus immersus RN42 TaxID=1160509 RepID=A0A3N4HKM8_ASCIM|nr:hypothetical protein BJ508DRAFT_366911 [Ascobolus immersus RN42]